MGTINLTRLKDCMLRAENGGELTIGFLGGSITQGSLATKPENCYAYRVYSWWKQAFPQAAFHYVNGGIGGTTSHFGVSRAETDVLMYQMYPHGSGREAAGRQTLRRISQDGD